MNENENAKVIEEIEEINGEIGSFEDDLARGERRFERKRLRAYEAFIRQAQAFPSIWVSKF